MIPAKNSDLARRLELHFEHADALDELAANPEAYGLTAEQVARWQEREAQDALLILERYGPETTWFEPEALN